MPDDVIVPFDLQDPPRVRNALLALKDAAAMLNGRTGGQVLYGGEGGEDLELHSNPDGDGTITLGTGITVDEQNGRLGVGIATPASAVHIFNGDLRIRSTGTTTSAILKTTSAGLLLLVNNVEMLRLGSLGTPPASASATGTVGQIIFGTDDRIYLCTGTNKWVRSAALATW
jgi:hypothetical protein